MSILKKKETDQLLKDFEYAELFNLLGWDYLNESKDFKIDEDFYSLNTVAEKRGFRVLICDANDNKMPNKAMRNKIERKVSKLYLEHIIIYFDRKKGFQLWQTAFKEPNQPIRVREFEYSNHQDTEHIYSKLLGLLFEWSEESEIGVIDVTQRVRDQFSQNAEKVTKKFYVEFKAQHSAFLKFIQGIQSSVDQEWYASLMLNRLMFIYFIQKKGFLNQDFNYLRGKLKESKNKKGKDKFYSFYRNFLLVLFHQGLGKPNRSKELVNEIGRVPYLNGGLFDVHEMEDKYEGKIQIKDQAFEKLFDFFDKYEWHLDTSRAASANEINPDVIGYIFEKYINDRASMGAYYTKEDITEYISKNCIIPWLFDEIKRTCAVALEPHGSIWQLVKNNPDRYIYESMAKGCDLELPENIAVGLNDVSNRTEWNTPADENYSLPTEIWREVVARRNRYFEVKGKIEKGEIKEINDFITYNLNIRQFAQDAIKEYEGSDFIQAFYTAIAGRKYDPSNTAIKPKMGITILDPTCGSGAFLFAALNILEPLYSECIRRMKEFVEEDDQKGSGKKHPQFRLVLKEIENHPNERYYIYKSIILNNLYGVDIMKEAVEVAKIRLFLKLVSQVKPDYKHENLGIEPLPDIDFNIRAGNTLVGYSTEKELLKGLEWQLLNDENIKEKVQTQMEKVSLTFARFKEIQLALNTDEDYKTFKESKKSLQTELRKLNDILDYSLGKDYGQEPRTKEKQFRQWQESHQPFHWFGEYYGIFKEKEGFDCVIGNPPYIEYSKVRKTYTLRENQLSTISCGNIYAMVFDRAISSSNESSKIGLIVPVSLGSTKRIEPLINKIKKFSGNQWYSYYAERPSKLFNGAEVLLCIALIDRNKQTSSQHTTGLKKWGSDFRDFLFDTNHYVQFERTYRDYLIPRFQSTLEISVADKIFNYNKKLQDFYGNNVKSKVFYRIGGGRYWKIFTDFEPYFEVNGKQTSSSRQSELVFKSREEADAAISSLSSSLFFWYFVVTTNGRDLNPFDLNEFPINLAESDLAKLELRLMNSYKKHKQIKNKVSKQTGNVTYEEYYPRLSKDVIDQIDDQLAQTFNLNEFELDFIKNYDIKYRLGIDE